MPNKSQSLSQQQPLRRRPTLGGRWGSFRMASKKNVMNHQHHESIEEALPLPSRSRLMKDHKTVRFAATPTTAPLSPPATKTTEERNSDELSTLLSPHPRSLGRSRSFRFSIANRKSVSKESPPKPYRPRPQMTRKFPSFRRAPRGTEDNDKANANANDSETTLNFDDSNGSLATASPGPLKRLSSFRLSRKKYEGNPHHLRVPARPSIAFESTTSVQEFSRFPDRSVSKVLSPMPSKAFLEGKIGGKDNCNEGSTDNTTSSEGSAKRIVNNAGIYRASPSLHPPDRSAFVRYPESRHTSETGCGYHHHHSETHLLLKSPTLKQDVLRRSDRKNSIQRLKRLQQVMLRRDASNKTESDRESSICS
mmetsp:Transcript_17298/g.35560  ORF Transcript_17298/g.35560 Transcript_17298/m.35560 type:complete len:365 (+) Transcript_17298:88-1182(+)